MLPVLGFGAKEARKNRCRKDSGLRENATELTVAENVTVLVAVVVIEKVACKSRHIEVSAGKVRHIEGITFLEDMFREVFFGVPRSAVAFPCGIYIHINCDAGVGIKHFTVVIVKASVFLDAVESLFADATFGVPFFGKALEVLKHQFGVSLIPVKQVAELDEVLIIGEMEFIYRSD